MDGCFGRDRAVEQTPRFGTVAGRPSLSIALMTASVGVSRSDQSVSITLRNRDALSGWNHSGR